jgi:hypothetical protein
LWRFQSLLFQISACSIFPAGRNREQMDRG